MPIGGAAALVMPAALLEPPAYEFGSEIPANYPPGVTPPDGPVPARAG